MEKKEVSVRRIVVHTDIFLDYLLHRTSGEPDLRVALRRFFCYTTVFNAVELFATARTGRQRRAIEHSLRAVKILGVNARSAMKYGSLLARGPALPRMNTLIAGLCLDSSLPILTGRPDEFRGVREIRIIRPSSVLGAERLRRGAA